MIAISTQIEYNQNAWRFRAQVDSQPYCMRNGHQYILNGFKMKNGQYILIIPPKEYPGKRYRGRYAYEHHVVWWNKTNMIMPDGYCIHHKNENKHDNCFENLEMISISQHSKMHAKEKKLSALICDYCKTPFIRETKNVKFKSKIGQTKFYCSRSHQGKAQINRNKSRLAQ